MRELPSSIIVQFDTQLFHEANRIVDPMTWPLDDLLHDFFTGMIGHDADDTLDNIADYVTAEELVEEGTDVYEPVLPVEIRDMIYQFLVEVMEKFYYFVPEAYGQQYHYVAMTGGDSVLLKRRSAFGETSTRARGTLLDTSFYTQLYSIPLHSPMVLDRPAIQPEERHPEPAMKLSF